MSVGCLLDECDQWSYDAVDSMATILLDAIHAQGREGHSVQVLVRNAIRDEQEMLNTVAAMGGERGAGPEPERFLARRRP